MMTKDDLGLQPALQEVLNLQAKNVIQLHPIIRQNTSPERYIYVIHILVPLWKLT